MGLEGSEAINLDAACEIKAGMKTKDTAQKHRIAGGGYLEYQEPRRVVPRLICK